MINWYHKKDHNFLRRTAVSPLPPSPRFGEVPVSTITVLSSGYQGGAELLPVCEWEQREFNSVGQPRKDREENIDQKSGSDSIPVLFPVGERANALERESTPLALPRPATPHLG